METSRNTLLRSTNSALSAHDRVSLCEALDRVLNKGAVVAGDITVSVADIDLIYLGLQLVVTSIEKARTLGRTSPTVTRAVGPVEESDNGSR